ncbi:HAD family hydrolase [Schaalia sp. ZJ405]|uniref:Cof-type HAD-IIB family hydrolase n=1 Tax=Schaalia sp. ZJ405 TaxID=2709403 RepID=UPI0013E9CFEB|nr:Cof-type HAD-IIB family hydrolase [Schaalia sp. ZJ405]QPK81424.1 HAD family hydrolase [Schaalia sp. ZJ405]
MTLNATPTPKSQLPIGADIRLVAIDMDGTLLNDAKEFPEGLWELLDQLDERGIVFAPSSGRQAWTLLDMFPGREDMTVIGENGAIVMKNGEEISSSPVDHDTLHAAIDMVRAAVAGGVDGGIVLCGKQSAYVERIDDRFVDDVLPYYHRTQRVEDLHEVLCAMDRGEIDDAIVKTAIMCFDDVERFAEQSLARFADTHQYAVSGHAWADLQIRGVDKGKAVRDLQEALGITRAQTVAFGDFHNDLSMLAEADMAFAMANAHEDIIAACPYVAPSNNEDGVVQTLRLLLGLEEERA